MNTRTCNAPALPSGARAFFARLVLTGRRLSPAGRELARAQYLAAVEAELAASAERRTRTLAGMAVVQRTGRP